MPGNEQLQISSPPIFILKTLFSQIFVILKTRQMKEEVMHWYVIIPSHILLVQTAGDKTRLAKHLSLNPTHEVVLRTHVVSL